MSAVTVVVGSVRGGSFTFVVSGAVDEAKWAETVRVMRWKHDPGLSMFFALRRDSEDLGLWGGKGQPNDWPDFFELHGVGYRLTAAGLAAVDAALDAWRAA